MRGRPGGVAAGPVLLACRQWDPLGLAQRLPSRGTGAWRGAPLLPWGVQCPGHVCAALAAGSGGWGRCRVSCLPRFPLPTPRFPRCVWRAVPSGCPLSSLAGTPFHAVCAFRGLGLIAFLVFPVCPLRVRALALSRRPHPPFALWVGVARAPRAVPLLGAGRAVPLGPFPSACPASVPCSVWLAWGGGGAARSRFPPAWLGVVCPPLGTPQRALLRADFACCGGRTGASGGGASCLCVGRPGSGALPPPTAPPLGRAAGANYSLAVGAGGVCAGTRHQPDSARSCQLALCAVGAARGRPGRAPLACVWGVRGRALSHRRPFLLWGVLPGPLPTGCGCGGCGCGDPSPTPQRALLRASFARCGGGTRAPGVEASCLGVGRPEWGALPPPTAHPLGRAARAHYPLALRAGGVGVGTRHQPTARALASWLCALWGRHRGARGGRLLPGCGASGVGRSPTPDRSSFRGVLLGPTTHWLWVRGVRGWGPVTYPTAPALASWLCALSGLHEGAQGGAPLAWAWGVRCRALSHPRPLVLRGVRPGPTTHWLWVRREQAWGSVTNPTARALGN